MIGLGYKVYKVIGVYGLRQRCRCIISIYVYIDIYGYIVYRYIGI